MLRAVRNMLHGPLLDKWTGLPDANTWRKIPFVLLLGMLLIFGIWPRLLTDKITPSAEALLESSRLQVSADGPITAALQPPEPGQ
jgi:NADH-quinone oxidoreductase subunit M